VYPLLEEVATDLPKKEKKTTYPQMKPKITTIYYIQDATLVYKENFWTHKKLTLLLSNDHVKRLIPKYTFSKST